MRDRGNPVSFYMGDIATIWNKFPIFKNNSRLFRKPYLARFLYLSFRLVRPFEELPNLMNMLQERKMRRQRRAYPMNMRFLAISVIILVLVLIWGFMVT
jgi:hypothetical protein